MKINIKTTLITGLLFFVSSIIYAQDNIPENTEECGIELLETQVQYMNDTRDDRAETNISLLSEDDETLNFQIAVHIVRDSNGERGISLDNLNEAVNTLNETFEPVNFKYHICSIDYIDDDLYANGGVAQGFDSLSVEYQMALPYLMSDAIDIFFIPVLSNSGHNGWSSFPAYLNYYGKDWTVVKNTAANNGSTLPHEMGHYFSLYHTHEAVQGIELVNRISGSGCGLGIGDDLCDTPADPTGLVYNIEGDKYHIGYCRDYYTCEFTTKDYEQMCNVTDSIGDTYRPSTTNVMSYNNPHCRIDFSAEQIDRMRRSYFFDRDYLNNYCEVGCENMFVKYDWLEAVACLNTQTDITIYKHNDAFNFLDIKNGAERYLYLSDGNLFCSGPAVLACIEELKLTEILAECIIMCPAVEGCTDSNACNYDSAATINDETCDYGIMDCPDPCDESTCEGCESIFARYPWVENKVTDVEYQIKVYDYVEAYKFIEVNSKNDRTLYLSDGTEYCSGSHVDHCKDTFKLIKILYECDSIKVCEDVNACNYGEKEICTYGNANCSDPCDESTCPVDSCDDIFAQYPWIENEINCTKDTIKVYYYSDYWSYIEIKTSEGQTLYLSDGTKQCFDEQVSTCIESWGLILVDECVCAAPTAICEDPTACNFGKTGKCTYGNAECINPCDESTCPNCENIGTIVYEDCGGTNWRFLETDDGQIFDPYFDLLDQEAFEGDRIQFDFIINDEEVTPCTRAEQAISLTCMEIIQDCDEVFSDFPWLLNKVDPNNCTNESITVFSNGTNYFLYIEESTKEAETNAENDTHNGYNNVEEIAKWTCGCKSGSGNETTKSSGLKQTQRTSATDFSSFTMFPNPSQTVLHIELNYETLEKSTVQIFDLNGKTIQQHEFTGKRSTLNVSDLAKGMYLVKIQNSQNTQSTKNTQGKNTQNTQKLFIE